MRVTHLAGLLLTALLGSTASAAEWDSIRGATSTMGEPDDHWFLVHGRHSGYVVDGDEGQVKGLLTLSMFSPAMRPDLDAGMIYSYGSFYSRTYYGERTDAVLFFDTQTLMPVAEVVIPPKSAGIGHSGMIGLVDKRFIGVWNITPAMSVSVVDVQEREFVGEISTPGCAAVYPIGSGFLMPCGDGAMQYIALGADGTETSRIRSERFFDVEVDPVFDYAVSAGDDWLFMSLEGVLWRVGLDDGAIQVERVMSIFKDEDEAAAWRIGGRQAFAYNEAAGLLTTLMHEGGGQETFEDAGTEIWGFSMATGKRGYRLELDTPTRGVQLTMDARPLMIFSGDERLLHIHDGLSSAHKRTMKELGGGLIQPLQ